MVVYNNDAMKFSGNSSLGLSGKQYGASVGKILKLWFSRETNFRCEKYIIKCHFEMLYIHV